MGQGTINSRTMLQWPIPNLSFGCTLEHLERISFHKIKTLSGILRTLEVHTRFWVMLRKFLQRWPRVPVPFCCGCILRRHTGLGQSFRILDAL